METLANQPRMPWWECVFVESSLPSAIEDQLQAPAVTAKAVVQGKKVDIDELEFTTVFCTEKGLACAFNKDESRLGDVRSTKAREALLRVLSPQSRSIVGVSPHQRDFGIEIRHRFILSQL